MDRNKLLLVFALVFFVSTAAYVSIGVDRMAWFDEAFTLETVQLLNSGVDINFAEFDVHPPAYYVSLASWMSFAPDGLSETQWARFFSIFWGVVFFIFVYLLVRKLQFSSFVAGSVTLLMSLSTTFLHYFTEIRMYGMLLALTSVVIYLLFRFFNVVVIVTNLYNTRV